MTEPIATTEKPLHDFRPGDRVRCVNAEYIPPLPLAWRNVPEKQRAPTVVNGKTYTVSALEGRYLIRIEGMPFLYGAARFVKIPKE